MRRRQLLLWAALLVPLAAAGWLPDWETQPRPAVTREPGVTQENFHRLRYGQRQGDVEAILGQPGEFGCYVQSAYWLRWRGNGAQIWLFFDGQPGEVAGGSFTDLASGEMEDMPPDWPAPDNDEGILDRLRRLLPW